MQGLEESRTTLRAVKSVDTGVQDTVSRAAANVGSNVCRGAAPACHIAHTAIAIAL